jgi:hypothetical protein
VAGGGLRQARRDDEVGPLVRGKHEDYNMHMDLKGIDGFAFGAGVLVAGALLGLVTGFLYVKIKRK